MKAPVSLSEGSDPSRLLSMPESYSDGTQTPPRLRNHAAGRRERGGITMRIEILLAIDTGGG